MGIPLEDEEDDADDYPDSDYGEDEASQYGERQEPVQVKTKRGGTRYVMSEEEKTREFESMAEHIVSYGTKWEGMKVGERWQPYHEQVISPIILFPHR